jgi:hypothetical protein
MGAGASTRATKAPAEPSPTEIAALEPAYSRPTGSCFFTIPLEEELKKVDAGGSSQPCFDPAPSARHCPSMPQRSAALVLEVGAFGFRLLRPGSEDCLHAFPWGQIHSWAHTDSRFSFRFFDDRWAGVPGPDPDRRLPTCEGANVPEGCPQAPHCTARHDNHAKNNGFAHKKRR